MNDWLSSPAAAEAAVILVSLALGYLLGRLDSEIRRGDGGEPPTTPPPMVPV